jgi:16S rRNA (cytosine1402-N4)-methyltransferase
MDAEGDDETAAETLERLTEEEIANIIYGYGEERFSRRIARRIVERRNTGSPVRTTKELAELVERSVPRKPKDKIHPATKTFQALRIAVNRELEVLEGFLKDSIDLLRPNGRLAIISFHSLEDRMVKQAFLKASGKCQCPPRIPQCICGAAKQVEILTKKPITAGDDELDVNPRSRSAKLRAVRKLG